jgi:hypothetical protein
MTGYIYKSQRTDCEDVCWVLLALDVFLSGSRLIILDLHGVLKLI